MDQVKWGTLNGSQDGRRIAFAWYHTSVVWEFGENQDCGEWGDQSRVTSLEWSRDGTTITTGTIFVGKLLKTMPQDDFRDMDG